MSVIYSMNFQVGKKNTKNGCEPLWLFEIQRICLMHLKCAFISFILCCPIRTSTSLIQTEFHNEMTGDLNAIKSMSGLLPHHFECLQPKLELNNQSVTATVSAGKRRSSCSTFFLHKFSSFRAKITFATSYSYCWLRGVASQELGALRPTLQKTRRFRFHV